MADLSGEGPTIETFVVGENLPTSVIPKEKPWYVQVKWRTTGTDWARLAGSWDVQVFLEPIEPIESRPELPDRHLTVPLRSMPSPVNYGPVNYEFEAHSVSEGIYRLYVAVQYVDPNGRRSGMSSFAEHFIAILPEFDIRTAAEQAISTGVSVAADGKDIVATPEGVEVGKSSEGRSIVIPYDEAYDKIVNNIERVLELNHTQAREQAQRWFQASLIVAIVGIILVGIGVVTLMRGNTSTGIVSTISSVITEAIAALFFVQSRKANDRVDGITADLTESRKLFSLVGMVDTVTDQKSRDKLKAEFVLKVLDRDKKEG